MLELLLLFPDVNYLRVQVFVSVYSRILDLESTHAIFDEVLIFSSIWCTLHSVNNCETLFRTVGIAIFLLLYSTSSNHQLLSISLETLQAFKVLPIYLDLHWMISITTLCSVVFILFSLHPFLIPWYPLLCFLLFLYIVINTFAHHHICSPPTLFIPFRPLNSSSGVLRGWAQRMSASTGHLELVRPALRRQTVQIGSQEMGAQGVEQRYQLHLPWLFVMSYHSILVYTILCILFLLSLVWRQFYSFISSSPLFSLLSLFLFLLLFCFYPLRSPSHPPPPLSSSPPFPLQWLPLALTICPLSCSINCSSSRWAWRELGGLRLQV